MPQSYSSLSGATRHRPSRARAEVASVASPRERGSVPGSRARARWQHHPAACRPGVAEGLPRPQPPLRDELGDDLAVVEHLEVPAELRVLVGEGVEAVRALRDDLLEAVAPERLHVLLRERLEQVLVAEPARRVAVAGLLLA